MERVSQYKHATNTFWLGVTLLSLAHIFGCGNEVPESIATSELECVAMAQRKIYLSRPAENQQTCEKRATHQERNHPPERDLPSLDRAKINFEKYEGELFDIKNQIRGKEIFGRSLIKSIMAEGGEKLCPSCTPGKKTYRFQRLIRKFAGLIMALELNRFAVEYCFESYHMNKPVTR